MISFRVNLKQIAFAGETDTPLLWVLRDELKLTGAKYGCGIGQCGACTVLVDGEAQRSCVVPIATVKNKSITTIEGLVDAEGRLHPVQQAWLDIDVPQCGYCQAGQIMATVDFLQKFPSPSDEDIDKNMTNICRCGTYVRIRQAIHKAAKFNEAGE